MLVRSELSIKCKVLMVGEFVVKLITEFSLCVDFLSELEVIELGHKFCLPNMGRSWFLDLATDTCGFVVVRG